MQLTFTIEFQSDFHIGAGYGLGLHIDSALHRDPDGVPVIRGSILTGLLRESLADLLDLPFLHQHRRHATNSENAANTPPFCGQFAPTVTPPCPVCAIFGSPRYAKGWMVSSARPIALENPQSQRYGYGWRPGETAAQATTRTRVNPRTRRAEEGKLFTREDGDGALRFCFTVSSVQETEQTVTEAAWLWAAARATRRIGANKGRGRGECRIALMDQTMDTLCSSRFAQILQLSTAPTTVQSIASSSAQIKASTAALKTALAAPASTTPYRVRVLLRTDEPLLLAERSAAGNQYETLSLICGSILRGVLGWRMVHRLGAKWLEEASLGQLFQRLFFDGALHFSFLLPAMLNKDEDAIYPTMVAPRDLVTCELHREFNWQDGHRIWSLALGELTDELCPVCQAQQQNNRLKPIRGFLPLDETLLTNYQPKRTNEMHIRIEPRTGRVRTGDLYEYVALQPGQYFLGELTCHSQAVWQAFCQLLALSPTGTNQLRIGRASRRGYGQCTVEFSAQPAAYSLWHGTPLVERITNQDFDRHKGAYRLVITLLSDAIVLDPWGRSVRGFDSAWLHQELALPDYVTLDLDHNYCFSEAHIVDGFNNQLGLPRTREIALSAGSSAAVYISGVQDRRDLCVLLATVESAGIGVRRNEGFGMVAFNHPIYTGLVPSQIRLTPAMMRKDAARDHRQQQRLHFTTEWEAYLKEQFYGPATALWRQFNYEPFEGVARILHTTQETSAVGVEQLLTGLGDWRRLIQQELKGRQAKPFFQEKGKPGLTTLKTLVNALAEKIDDSTTDILEQKQLWRIGLPMVAAHVAAAALRQPTPADAMQIAGIGEEKA